MAGDGQALCPASQTLGRMFAQQLPCSPVSSNYPAKTTAPSSGTNYLMQCSHSFADLVCVEEGGLLVGPLVQHKGTSVFRRMDFVSEEM